MTRTFLIILSVVTAVVIICVPDAVAQQQSDEQAMRGDQTFRLLTPDRVMEIAGRDDVKILDVRASVSDYQHGHVPGAVHVANGVMRVPDAGIPVQYLGPEVMAQIFRRCGINTGDTVIVYADEADVLGTTMIAYCLHRIGHRNVAMMDGGIEAFRVRYALTQAYPKIKQGNITAELDESVFVTYDQVRDMMNKRNVTILDTRPTTQFLGNTPRWIRNGHIPGAVNLDWHHMTHDGNQGKFKPIDQIRKLVAATGVEKDDEVILYCGTSREATLMYHTMKHLLGYPKVRVYEGSWTEYCSIEDAPMARDGRVVTPDDVSPAQRIAGTPELQPYSCGDIERIHIYGNYFLASQPAPADFEHAAKQGIKAVIHFSYPDETDFDEQKIVEKLGMIYHLAPFDGVDDLDAKTLDLARELIKSVKTPAMLHCSSANRTGAVWLAYRILDTGADFEQALKEAKTIGLRTPGYIDVVREYVKNNQ